MWFGTKELTFLASAAQIKIHVVQKLLFYFPYKKNTIIMSLVTSL